MTTKLNPGVVAVVLSGAFISVVAMADDASPNNPPALRSLSSSGKVVIPKPASSGREVLNYDPSPPRRPFINARIEVRRRSELPETKENDAGGE